MIQRRAVAWPGDPLDVPERTSDRNAHQILMSSYVTSSTTMNPCRTPYAVLLAALLLWVTDIPAGPHTDEHDHDRARAALERGEVRPIAEVLSTVAQQVPGDVVEVELEREHGRWAYELKIIAPDGRVLEVLVDAATATIIKTEQD